jgi:hypothetical protein
LLKLTIFRNDLLGIIAMICSASSLAGEKGQPRHFFAQLASVQECFEPQS